MTNKTVFLETILQLKLYKYMSFAKYDFRKRLMDKVCSGDENLSIRMMIYKQSVLWAMKAWRFISATTATLEAIKSGDFLFCEGTHNMPIIV